MPSDKERRGFAVSIAAGIPKGAGKKKPAAEEETDEEAGEDDEAGEVACGEELASAISGGDGKSIMAALRAAMEYV